jgi:aryl-alcohol dehydrogenase-like predicted oxidoreductase
MSLVHLAVAFVLAHPGVTSAIIGPRTMEQLETQLGAADVTLSADVLDAIDQINPPGRNMNRADSGYVPPSLVDSGLRRR